VLSAAVSRPGAGSYVTAAAMADKAGGKSAAARKRQYPVARVKGSWCDAEDEALRRCGEAGSSGSPIFKWYCVV
jgi:hypothetical protein